MNPELPDAEFNMSFFKRLFGKNRDEQALMPLYRWAQLTARQPHWYVEGEVPDTIEGRFDMLALVTSLALLRLEQLGADEDAVSLTELFVNDMDGQLREVGIGDMVVGKHIGKLVGALGGRLGAMREALLGDAELKGALARNLYPQDVASEVALAHAEKGVRETWGYLANLSREQLLEIDSGG